MILSAESFHGLPSWHEPERLLSLARIAVTPRDGFEMAGPAWLADHFPGHEDRVTFLEAPRILSGQRAPRADCRWSLDPLPRPRRGDPLYRDHDLYHAQPGDRSER